MKNLQGLKKTYSTVNRVIHRSQVLLLIKYLLILAYEGLPSNFYGDPPLATTEKLMNMKTRPF